MTEDPIKLYVVVMAILVCVLAWVANTSYSKATAFEEAIADAPKHAEELREYAGDVAALCDQLSGTKIGRGGGNFFTLIEDAAKYNNIVHSGLREESEKRIGSKGVEQRFKLEIRSGGTGASPVSRDTIARFCQQVELDSRGILKTIELQLRRYSGAQGVPAGEHDEVVGDTYTGSIIFGLRVVKQ